MHLLMLCLILWPLAAQAAWLQYDLSTGFITGGPRAAEQDVPDVPGSGKIDDPALSVSAPVWPVPGGCPTGTGQQTWTQLSPGQVLPLIVRPDLLWFATTSPLLPGCHLVSTWRELKRLYEATIIEAIAAEDLATAISALNGWKDVRCVSPADDGNANCQAWAVQQAIINDRLPGRGQGVTLSTNIATLIVDAFNFRAAQGW